MKNPTENENVLKTYSNNNSNVYDDETSKYLREQNYKALFNSQVQAYQRQQLANKYLSDSMKSSGYAQTGTGANIQVQNNNEIQDLYRQNQADYDEKDMTISSDLATRNETKTQNELNQMNTYFSNADTNDKKDKILQNYGYMDESGNWTDKFNSLDESTKADIQSMYDTETDNTDTTGLGSTYDSNNIVTYNVDGGMSMTSGQFNSENDTLNSQIASGNLKDDSYIVLRNEDGKETYLYYSNGSIYNVSKDRFNQNNENAIMIYGTNGEILSYDLKSNDKVTDIQLIKNLDQYAHGNFPDEITKGGMPIYNVNGKKYYKDYAGNWHEYNE